jgi:hypothetical protein
MSTIPSEAERLLLRACVCDGREALDAWATWRDSVVLDDAGGESLQLLPLLYRNLGRLGVPAEETRRYASSYRHHWAANRLAFRAAGRVIERFEAAGIPTLLSKGAALTLSYYRDVGVRSMGDVDVLIPPDRLHEAFAIVAERGYRLAPETRVSELTPAWLSLHNGANFRDDHGRAIDVHWYACADACTPGADAAFWQAALPVTFEGVSTRALAPSDLLYAVLVHGFSSHARHLRWAADSVTIMAQAEVDWARVVRHAVTRRMVPAIAWALAWVKSELGAPVPDSALAMLAEADVSLIDRLEHHHRRSARPDSFGKVLLRLWCWHRRTSEARGAVLVAGFPRFLARYYGAEPWRVPGLVLRRGVARLVREGL